MKITKIIIGLLAFFCIVFTNCSSTQEKEESEQASETSTAPENKEATPVQADTEPQPDNSKLLEEYADAKIGWFETISENEKLIAGLKSAVLAEKGNIQADHQKKLTVLEQLNNKQKTKIALYKPQKEENWKRFKELVSNDLTKINEDLKTLRKEVL